MFETLPATAQEFSTWTWPQIEKYFADLAAHDLTASTIDGWLASWSRLHALLDEVSTRYIIATTTNTADTEAERGYTAYLDEIAPQAMAAEQRLKQKLIESGLEPQGFAVPLRKMRTEAGIYREANVPLLAEHRKLLLEYDRIAGVRMVQWEGE